MSLQGQEHISSHTKLHSQHPSPLYNIKTHTATQRHHKAAIPSNHKVFTTVHSHTRQARKQTSRISTWQRQKATAKLVSPIRYSKLLRETVLPRWLSDKEYRSVSLNFHTLCTGGGENACHGRHGGQRTTCCNQSSPSTTKAPGIKSGHQV